ncbi:Uu.00g144740.m01.CDS01 [Anthostomella pinea]|uniref:Uu.00g144740.m01.CDS01 n=1 Tax=Anthostomella pinea TaxID=933095 RepID=A0AAI8VRT6_9PEZI|nr:Uu.00g144740.m01.CDS01 [Anthostomella pinea]
MPGSTVTQAGGRDAAPRHSAIDRVSNMNVDGASDRPSGSRRGSEAGSQRGSQGGSQRGSQAGSPPKGSAPKASTTAGDQRAYPKPLGYDPGRDRPPMTEAELIGKRVDLPADAYNTGKDDSRFTARPGFNTSGKEVKVQLNTFPVVGWKDQDIIQYDLSVSPNPKDSRALIKKVWNSRAVTQFLEKNGGTWLFDGNKLAWSSAKIPRGEMRITVDLDNEAGKTNKLVGNKGVYYLHGKQTNVVRLAYLKTYLEGKIPWDSHVLECMNFFDHCMRHYPASTMQSIRRNFYAPEVSEFALSNHCVAQKGYYSAIRLGESIKTGGTGLSINVDVANTAFWAINDLANTSLRILNAYNPQWKNSNFIDLVKILRPVKAKDKAGNPVWIQSDGFRHLRRIYKLRFVVNHRGKLGDPKVYTVGKLLFDQKYGEEGAHSKAVFFNKRQKDGTTKNVSVWQYFWETYHLRLQYPSLPIMESTRGALFPLEVCNVSKYQRYSFKLSPDETAQMIKFAVTRPDQRKKDILSGIAHLGFSKDPNLAAFGIKIQEQMTVTSARVLPNPEITYANQKVNPGVSGRWDLRGKRFLEPNAKKLVSWAFVGCGDACTKQGLEAFASKFQQAYRTHGGVIEKPAVTMMLPFSMGDYGTMVEAAWSRTGSQNKAFPQILFFVVPNKNQLVYDRIKKSMDCRWNVVSQVLQGAHVEKCQAQYMSNVAMKVNAKLGGVTCKVAGPNATTPPFFRVPTMMIGLDVSHASPGSSAPSIAAMTVSTDKHATRYAAACETNGWRVEIATGTTMHTLFPRLLKYWIDTNKCFPQHVYFLRDGCAEGQFQQVIERELKEIKRMFREANAPAPPKFTVIVATKRHHIRFFPKPGDKASGDRNNNPLPGTLVEHDATHPHHWDFYLCSHVAIQGTARPVHYQVIYDDAQCKPDHLQAMLYHQCYQYCRSTTPVSLHPAVYYSHLASQRARCHENIASSQRELPILKEGFPFGKQDSEVYSGAKPLEAPPLVPMMNPKQPGDIVAFMNTTMWYV